MQSTKAPFTPPEEVPPPVTPLWEHQNFDTVRKGGGPAKKHMLFKKKKYGLVLGGEKEGQTFMLRMIRRASVNLKLKTEWNYYSYLAKISVKLLILPKIVSYNPISAKISVKI